MEVQLYFYSPWNGWWFIAGLSAAALNLLQVYIRGRESGGLALLPPPPHFGKKKSWEKKKLQSGQAN